MTKTTAPVQSLHDQIMRLPCDPAEYTNVNMMLAYKSGHRDARHAAAELAAEHEAEQQQELTAIEAMARMLEGGEWAEHVGQLGGPIAQRLETEITRMHNEQQALIAKQVAQVAVQDGYRMVPAEPTQEMWAAYRNADRGGVLFHQAYRAMLSAAPTPPAQQPVGWIAIEEPFHGTAGIEAGEWDIQCDGKAIDKLASANSPGRIPLYAAPPAQQSQWVPVSERRPAFPSKGKCYVLALQKGSRFPFPVRWTGTRWEYMDGDTARNITHWMPLPSAPGDTAAPEPTATAREQLRVRLEQAEQDANLCGIKVVVDEAMAPGEMRMVSEPATVTVPRELLECYLNGGGDWVEAGHKLRDLLGGGE